MKTARELTHELQLERQKLEKIFQESPAAMALWRGDDLALEKANHLYTDYFPRILSVQAADPFRDRCESVYETGEPYIGHEICINGGEFESRYFDISIVRIDGPDKRPYGVFNHCVDVTGRILSRKALEMSQEQFYLALESGKLGFFDRDLINDTTIFSDRMRKDWGIPDGVTVTPEMVTMAVHPDDRELRAAKIEAAKEQRKPYQHEFRIIKPDGTLRWMSSSGHCIYGKCGRPYRFFGTCMDITDRKKASDELRIAKEAAEQANETKSSFLANMSHEIRTPLGAIIGFTDLLREGNISKSERARYTEIISKSAKGLAAIIDDILDLSKVEAGHLQTEQTELDLRRIIHDALDLFETKAKSKGVDLRLDIGAGVPDRICSDPTRMRQILINLIGNAVKFTSKGEVTLRVRTTHVHHDLHRLNVDVIDTGPGISPAEGSKLFTPFTQADNSTTRKHGGTGLGLALSKKLAQAMGGDLSFRSKVNRGTVFSLTMDARVPARQESRPDHQACAPAGGAYLRGMNILLADDSVDNQILINTILSKHGASVATVENGAEAVRRALNEHFDLILMDIQMPVMDGNEATKRLRKSGYDKPIYALTAHAMVEEREKSRDAGCDGHLTKPLDMKRLLRTVSEAGHREH